MVTVYFLRPPRKTGPACLSRILTASLFFLFFSRYETLLQIVSDYLYESFVKLDVLNVSISDKKLHVSVAMVNCVFFLNVFHPAV